MAIQFEDDAGSLHCQIVKYSTFGDSLWAVDQGSGTWPKALVTDEEGNIYVAGKMENGIVTKLDPDGNELWSTYYNGIIYVTNMTIDNQNNVFLCGQSGSDCITIKFVQETVHVRSVPAIQSLAIEMHPIHPNPFSGKASIRYWLNISGMVELKIYDAYGNEVKNLVNQFQSVGMHEVLFEGNGLLSGMYFCRLRLGKHSVTKKIVLQNE
jgi:hypothetical protein